MNLLQKQFSSLSKKEQATYLKSNPNSKLKLLSSEDNNGESENLNKIMLALGLLLPCIYRDVKHNQVKRIEFNSFGIFTITFYDFYMEVQDLAKSFAKAKKLGVSFFSATYDPQESFQLHIAFQQLKFNKNEMQLELAAATKHIEIKYIK